MLLRALSCLSRSSWRKLCCGRTADGIVAVLTRAGAGTVPVYLGGFLIPDDHVFDAAWDAPLTAAQWSACRWMFEDRCAAAIDVVWKEDT